MQTFDYKALQEEVDALPYGERTTADFSPELKRYIAERARLGRLELERRERLKLAPKGQASTNGYSALLGVWYYTSKGLDAAVDVNKCWMATLKNHPLLRLEDWARWEREQAEGVPCG
jgi:hypothetical protein